MFNITFSKPAAIWSAVLILTLASLACGSVSSPQVTLPEATSPSQDTQPVEVQPTSMPPTEAAKPLGSARSNPAPLGAQVSVDNMTFMITEVVAPANDIVREGNQFNSEPEPGQQYIFVNISATCDKGTDDTCNIGGFEFSLIDSSGITHDTELFVAGVNGLLEPGDFYGGAAKTGYLVFLAPEGDEGLILKYEALFGGEAYFALK